MEKLWVFDVHLIATAPSLSFPYLQTRKGYTLICELTSSLLHTTLYCDNDMVVSDSVKKRLPRQSLKQLYLPCTIND